MHVWRAPHVWSSSLSMVSFRSARSHGRIYLLDGTSSFFSFPFLTKQSFPLLSFVDRSLSGIINKRWRIKSAVREIMENASNGFNGTAIGQLHCTHEQWI